MMVMEGGFGSGCREREEQWRERESALKQEVESVHFVSYPQILFPVPPNGSEHPFSESQFALFVTVNLPVNHL